MSNWLYWYIILSLILGIVAVAFASRDEKTADKTKPIETLFILLIIFLIVGVFWPLAIVVLPFVYLFQSLGTWSEIKSAWVPLVGTDEHRKYVFILRNPYYKKIVRDTQIAVSFNNDLVMLGILAAIRRIEDDSNGKLTPIELYTPPSDQKKVCSSKVAYDKGNYIPYLLFFALSLTALCLLDVGAFAAIIAGVLALASMYIGVRASIIKKKDSETYISYAVKYTSVQFLKRLYCQSNIVDAKGVEFETAVACIFGNNGYNATVTPPSKDGGIDIILLANDEKIAVQVKSGQKVGIGVIRETIASASDFNANKSMVVSKNGFTSDAIEYAKSKDVDLYDFERLQRDFFMTCDVEFDFEHGYFGDAYPYVKTSGERVHLSMQNGDSWWPSYVSLDPRDAQAACIRMAIELESGEKYPVDLKASSEWRNRAEVISKNYDTSLLDSDIATNDEFKASDFYGATHDRGIWIFCNAIYIHEEDSLKTRNVYQVPSIDWRRYRKTQHQ